MNAVKSGSVSRSTQRGTESLLARLGRLAPVAVAAAAIAAAAPAANAGGCGFGFSISFHFGGGCAPCEWFDPFPECVDYCPPAPCYTPIVYWRPWWHCGWDPCWRPTPVYLHPCPPPVWYYRPYPVVYSSIYIGPSYSHRDRHWDQDWDRGHHGDRDHHDRDWNQPRRPDPPMGRIDGPSDNRNVTRRFTPSQPAPTLPSDPVRSGPSSPVSYVKGRSFAPGEKPLPDAPRMSVPADRVAPPSKDASPRPRIDDPGTYKGNDRPGTDRTLPTPDSQDRSGKPSSRLPDQARPDGSKTIPGSGKSIDRSDATPRQYPSPNAGLRPHRSDGDSGGGRSAPSAGAVGSPGSGRQPGSSMSKPPRSSPQSPGARSSGNRGRDDSRGKNRY